METLIVFISVVFIFHFIYESVILPSFHNYLRFKIYILRDKLCDTVFEDKSKISPFDFNFLMQHLQVCYLNIDKITFSLLIETHHILKLNNNDPDESELIEMNQVVFDGAKDIEEKTSKYMFYGFLANSFMLFIYFSPIILTILFFATIFGSSKKLYNHLVRALSISADEKFDNAQTSGKGFCYPRC